MKKLIKYFVGSIALVAVLFVFGNISASASSSLPVYDLSEFQQELTIPQAKKLKETSAGVILRVQYGSNYRDKVFVHNEAICRQAGLKYGVYSYSMYSSPADAKQEARDLVQRSPHASYYANDYEQVTTSQENASANAWYHEVKRLAPNKKVILYSGSYFMSVHLNQAKNTYDGLWEANYGGSPRFNPVLHQYTDHAYVPAIGKSVDASHLINKPISWLLGEKAAKQINSAQYSFGGVKVREIVHVKDNSHIMNANGAKISPSVAKYNLKVTAEKPVRIGHSKQAVLVSRNGQVIGWIKAQSVTGRYYSSPQVKKLQATKTIYTYGAKKGARVSKIKKGTILRVNHIATQNYFKRAFSQGHSTVFTTNKDFVKWVK